MPAIIFPAFDYKGFPVEFRRPFRWSANPAKQQGCPLRALQAWQGITTKRQSLVPHLGKADGPDRVFGSGRRDHRFIGLANHHFHNRCSERCECVLRKLRLWNAIETWHFCQVRVDNS
ncbi:hypothetical protein D3C72_2153080 [compost metagenome]